MQCQCQQYTYMYADLLHTPLRQPSRLNNTTPAGSIKTDKLEHSLLPATETQNTPTKSTMVKPWFQPWYILVEM